MLVHATAVLRRSLPVVMTALVALLAGCGGDDADPQREGAKQSITVWILEKEPDRMRATKANVADFTRRTGIRVELVGVGDEELARRISDARAKGALPDVAQLPLPTVHALARRDLLDESAAEDVVSRLGDDTFSQTALTLVSRGGRLTAVPSDGWGQLLIYRRDLLEAAGLEEPQTLDAVVRAARRLHRPGRRAGITLATAPGEQFTAESFEHVALAAGCQLVDDSGAVQLDSPRCREAFRVYVELARRYGPEGVQNVDTTRDTYFAGRAAMVFWSPFLLDAMAGLRDDAVPDCPECKRDRAFLARNSGLVGVLGGGNGSSAQFGNIATWGISKGQDIEPAKRFVTYMLSDGYERWLALSPQGKYPVRAGDSGDPQRFYTAWEGLKSGVERKAPLRRFYDEQALETLREGANGFSRWGFQQGQEALAGALRDGQPVARALGAAIRGERTPDAAAAESQRAVERLQAQLE